MGGAIELAGYILKSNVESAESLLVKVILVFPKSVVPFGDKLRVGMLGVHLPGASRGDRFPGNRQRENQSCCE
jgi:hypothetical protein